MLDTVVELRDALRKALTSDAEYITSEEFRVFGSLTLAYLEKLERRVKAQGVQQKEIMKALGIVAQQIQSGEHETIDENAEGGDAAPAGGGSAGPGESVHAADPNISKVKFPEGLATGGPPGAKPQVKVTRQAAPVEEVEEELPKPDIVADKAVNIQPIPRPAGNGSVKA